MYKPLAPTVRDVDGVLVVDWPDPRPQSFTITPEAFEVLIGTCNARAQRILDLTARLEQLALQLHDA